MKFNDVSKDAQVILMGAALASVVEVFCRDEEDKGKKLIETALRHVGLTFEEFRILMADYSPEVGAEVESIQTVAADSDDDFEEDEDVEICDECDHPIDDCVCGHDVEDDYAHLSDDDLYKIASEIKPDENFDLWDRASMIALIERDYKEREEDNPYRVDTSNMDENGWENLEEEE